MIDEVLCLTDFMLDHACSLLGLTFRSFLGWNITLDLDLTQYRDKQLTFSSSGSAMPCVVRSLSHKRHEHEIEKAVWSLECQNWS